MGSTNTRLDDETHAALAALGNADDTFDDVVRRLIRDAHGEGAVERLAEKYDQQQ